MSTERTKSVSNSDQTEATMGRMPGKNPISSRCLPRHASSVVDCLRRRRLCCHRGRETIERWKIGMLDDNLKNLD